MQNIVRDSDGVAPPELWHDSFGLSPHKHAEAKVSMQVEFVQVIPIRVV